MKLSNLISKNNLIFLLPILSGILLILAYPPFDLEFLIWIALIPLFLFITSKKISFSKAFVGGTFCGILFFGKLFDWLFSTYPFEWLSPILGKFGKETVFVFIFLIVLWIIQTIFLGLFFGVFSWTIKQLKKANFWYLLVIPCLWIVLEYLRAWGFEILYLGKETFFGPHWTFGNLAYALHNKLVLAQIADIFGIYGISFLIVLINMALFLILKNKFKDRITVWALALVIIIGLIWGFYGTYKMNGTDGTNRTPQEVYRIALLQTNFLSGNELNPYSKKEAFKTVLNLFRSQESKKEGPNIIIAPEGFGAVSLTGDTEIARYLLGDFWHSGQIYLENQKIIEENEKTVSRLFYYNLEKEEPIAFYDKMLLVPNGEFLPYLTKALLNIFSFDIGYGQRFYKRGENIEPAFIPLRGTTARLGGSICSSIVSPSIQRQMTKKGAEVLIVVSSDAPFHGAKALLAQNLAMSKLRAIENRRYFAQATNMGYSFLLNQKGEIIAKNPELGNKIIFSNIYLMDKKTIYTKFGDWIVILAGLIFIGFIIKRFLTFNF